MILEFSINYVKIIASMMLGAYVYIQLDDIALTMFFVGVLSLMVCAFDFLMQIYLEKK